MSEPETNAMPLPDRELLKQFLATRKVKCPACEYSLTGLASDVCPECGLTLGLEIAHVISMKCPVCKYSLTGLTSGVCPECGLAVETKMTLADPKQGLYITGLVGLGAGIGFSVLLLCYFAAINIVKTASFNVSDIYPLIGGALIEITALIYWARSWGFFQRCSRRTGWAMASACWVVTVAIAITFFAGAI